MIKRKYYEAYDERYKTAHKKELRWFGDEPSAIVLETINKYKINKEDSILELGCGEGRDAHALLKKGYRLLATDISETAIEYCKRLDNQYENFFEVLDCVKGSLDEKFDFIYAVAVVHMLLLDEDRTGFYQFIYNHMAENGITLICTMGDGIIERQSDINTAFELQERECSGETLWVAGTSCRMVNEQNFTKELIGNGFEILEMGQTSIPEVFPTMMYAVVRKSKRIYIDTTELGCTSVWMKDAEIIPAGTTVYSMVERHKNEGYERFAKEYDIHFIFNDNVPVIDFYTIPRVDIFATDSECGYIGTIGEMTDLEGDAPICYINKEKNCYLICKESKNFLQVVSFWKEILEPYEEIKFYASKMDAIRENEFIDLSEYGEE